MTKENKQVSLKVKELINYLKTMNEDANVFVATRYGYNKIKLIEDCGDISKTVLLKIAY